MGHQIARPVSKGKVIKISFTTAELNAIMDLMISQVVYQSGDWIVIKS